MTDKKKQAISFTPDGKEADVANKEQANETEKKATEATQAQAKKVASEKARVASSQKRRKAQEEKPLEPSPKQPFLDNVVKNIKEKIGENIIEKAFINRPNDHLPTLIVSSSNWLKLAQFLKEDESFSFDYLRNLTGVDYEEHMEVVYHLYSFSHKHDLCVRVTTDREQPTIPSTVALWAVANWNEREVYDLLGIDFPGHPNLERIMMPDDWVGHPLRKDYEPLDKEI